MIYLGSVLKTQSRRLKPVNSANLSGHVVSAITIMDNTNVRQWLRGGEIVLAGSHTLPTEQNQLQELLSQLKISQACCLIIKCVTSPISSQKFSNILLEEEVLPIFKMSSNITYLELMNDVNMMLFKDRQVNRLAELDLEHLLRTDKPSDSDFDYISSVNNIDLYKQNACVIQITLASQTNLNHRIHDLFTLSRQLHAIFSSFITNRILSSYFVLENSDGATMILFTGSKLESDVSLLHHLQLSSQVKISNQALYIGISTLHPARELHKCYQEAVFSIKMAQIFNYKNTVTKFNDVAVWSLVEGIQESASLELTTQRLKEVLKNQDLFKTLKLFFQNNESIKKTSQQMFTHPNTIRYRLKEIKSQTGLDYQKTDDKFRLYIAVITQTLAHANN